LSVTSAVVTSLSISTIVLYLSLVQTAFKMARISESVGLSDSHAILLEDSLRESRILREKVLERDVESILKFQEQSIKVDRLCQILDQKQTERNTKNKKGSKIYVPTGCRVSFSIL